MQLSYDNEGGHREINQILWGCIDLWFGAIKAINWYGQK